MRRKWPKRILLVQSPGVLGLANVEDNVLWEPKDRREYVLADLAAKRKWRTKKRSKGQ